jgi:hypothetical protein
LDDVIEKIECCLAGWKMMYLSKGGKITLIKSTLSNLPTYSLSFFPFLAGVAQSHKEVTMRFLVLWFRRRVQISLSKLVQGLFSDFYGWLGV